MKLLLELGKPFIGPRGATGAMRTETLEKKPDVPPPQLKVENPRK